MEKPVHEVLTEALNLMDEGREWRNRAACGDGLGYCAFGAIAKVRGRSFEGGQYDPAVTALLRNVPNGYRDCAVLGRIYEVGRGFAWNDERERTFADIKGAFVRAIDEATPKLVVQPEAASAEVR